MAFLKLLSSNTLSELIAKWNTNADEFDEHTAESVKHRQIFIGENYPTPEEETLMGEGDLWFILEPMPPIVPISPEEWEQGSLSGATGEPQIATHRIRTIDYFNITPSTPAIISWDVDGWTAESKYPSMIFMQYDANNNYLTSSGWVQTPFTITTNPNATKAKMLFKVAESTAVSTQDITLVAEDISKINPVLTEN